VTDTKTTGHQDRITIGLANTLALARKPANQSIDHSISQ